MVLRSQEAAATSYRDGLPPSDVQLEVGATNGRFSEKEPTGAFATEAFPDRAIVLIESRQLIRDGIRRSLENALAREIFAVSSVAECAARGAKCRSAVVILSTIGNANDAIASEHLAALTEAGAGLSTIVMGDHDQAANVLRLFNQGARGFIPTSMPLAVAVQAIELVAAGGCFVPSSSLLACVTEAVPTTKTAPASLNNIFTTRQAAVIEALRRGKANKIIAYELNMCESTVKVHVRNIMKKLNAKNRTEVAYRANELLVSIASS